MYYVYFIICESTQVAYVGISRAKDSLAILRKHLRGEVAETRSHFDAETVRSMTYIHICARRHFAREGAHIDARYWRRFLLRQKYTVIGNDIVPDSLMKSSYAAIELGLTEQLTLQEVLTAEGAKNLRSISCGEMRKTLFQKTPGQASDAMLSIRVKTEMAQAFRDFAKEHGGTQSHAFGALLDAYSGDSSFEVEDLRERLREAHRRNSELAEDLMERTQKLDRKVKQQKERLDVLTQTVTNAIRRLEFTPPNVERRVPVYSRKQAKKLFPERSSYTPPCSAGTSLLRVDCMAYGHSASGCRQPLFVYGTTFDDGKRIRLRWYPGKAFVGFTPAHKHFRDSSLLWQIGYVEAADGAMELVGAIPVDPNHLMDKSIPWELLDPTAITEMPEDKPNLDDLVDDAKNRSTKRSAF